jgi:2,4-dienoyl-CoA reductase (NADPH2)
MKIGNGFEPGTAWPVMAELRRMGVKKYPFTGVREIKNGEAVLDVREPENDEIKETVTAPCDTVVMAVGARPNDSLYNELTAKGVRAYNIGDSMKVTNAINGIGQACELVEELAGIK